MNYWKHLRNDSQARVWLNRWCGGVRTIHNLFVCSFNLVVPVGETGPPFLYKKRGPLGPLSLVLSLSLFVVQVDADQQDPGKDRDKYRVGRRFLLDPLGKGHSA